jgi:hypothetical protein
VLKKKRKRKKERKKEKRHFKIKLANGRGSENASDVSLVRQKRLERGSMEAWRA